jgi:hypothetical protein
MHWLFAPRNTLGAWRSLWTEFLLWSFAMEPLPAGCDATFTKSLGYPCCTSTTHVEPVNTLWCNRLAVPKRTSMELSQLSHSVPFSQGPKSPASLAIFPHCTHKKADINNYNNSTIIHLSLCYPSSCVLSFVDLIGTLPGEIGAW